MEAVIKKANGILAYSLFNYKEGKYKEALISGEHALNIMEKTLPAYHPYLAGFYGNVGIIYQAMQEYEIALVNQNNAYKCMVNGNLQDQTQIARYHGNIALIYKDMGEYKKASENMKIALSIYEKSLPLDYLAIASTYSNIGSICEKVCEYNNALKAFTMAQDIMEKRLHLPPDDLNMIKIQINISAVLTHLHEYEKALEIINRTLENNTRHPNIAAALNQNKATILHSMDEHREALEYDERSLIFYKKSLSPNHPKVAELYADIIIRCCKLGMNDKIREYIGILIDLTPSVYLSFMQIYNDELRKKQMQKFIFIPSLIFSMVGKYPGCSHRKLYNVVLHTKDIDKEAEYVIRETIMPEIYPEHAETFRKLQDMRRLYQDLIINNSANKNEIVSLLEDIRGLELILAPYVREIDFKLHMESLSPEKVLKNLRQDHALLEYGTFYDEDQSDKPGRGKNFYYAFLLCDGKIEMFYLNAEEVINNELHSARKNIILNEHNDTCDASKELSMLYQLLIAPVINNFENIKHLYIAPDGELFKLPFELLLDENGTSLSDKVTVSYLSSGRDIARLEKWNKTFQGYSSAAILADPSYDLSDGTAQTQMDGDSKRGIISNQSHDIKKLKKCDRLPFARAEADAFEKVFEGAKEKRYQLKAKKNALNELGSPDIIHIATHGFYLEKQEQSRDVLFSVDRIDARSNIEDPLLRCGLMFAGVNDWLDSNKQDPPEDYGDGILNAKEVLSLNLQETDLLVLSACETGLGRTRNGEGIQGLRRVFELAGVRTLVCTLWNVDDVAGAILMEQFYLNLIKKNMEKLPALLEAKKYLREMTNGQLVNYYKENGHKQQLSNIEEQCMAFGMSLDEFLSFPEFTEDKPYKHPYYWAGYILQGYKNHS